MRFKHIAQLHFVAHIGVVLTYNNDTLVLCFIPHFDGHYAYFLVLAWFMRDGQFEARDVTEAAYAIVASEQTFEFDLHLLDQLDDAVLVSEVVGAECVYLLPFRWWSRGCLHV
jgi:hypothetical protein